MNKHELQLKLAELLEALSYIDPQSVEAFLAVGEEPYGDASWLYGINDATLWNKGIVLRMTNGQRFDIKIEERS